MEKFEEKLKSVGNAEFPVVEIFNSIQGEGFFAGRCATFIRLAGCNLKCSFCDTDHSPKMGEMSIRDIVEKINGISGENLPRLIVVTGGEPTIHEKLDALFFVLKHIFKSPDLAIETNGTNPLMLFRLKTLGICDLITVSPKGNNTSREILDSIMASDEVKIVLCEGAKPNIYEHVMAKHFQYHTAFIQACSENYAPVIEFLKSNPKWRLSVQIQKIIGVL